MGNGLQLYGQLGNGRNDQIQKTPVKIFDKGIKNIVAGFHTLVHKEDGSVWGITIPTVSLVMEEMTTFKKHLLKFLIRALKILLLVVTTL